jgi:hypothetical protein
MDASWRVDCDGKFRKNNKHRKLIEAGYAGE